MDSPFPGMDPYLERFWNDVHGKLIAYIADALNELLPPRYRATLQERVVIADIDEPGQTARYPDVAVLDWPDGDEGGVATAVHSQLLLIRQPEILRYESDPLKEYFVEILDSKSGEKVVTAIEVLSPDNKRPGDGMAQFQRKQAEYRSAGVNRVEIDLLREGKRMFEFPETLLSPQRQKPYYVTVYRAVKPGECELYAIDLRDRLPVVHVPLRAEDRDVHLALQPLMNRVYRNGRFPINYDEPSVPPLQGADADWGRQAVTAGKLKVPPAPAGS
jgi:hypothetical protein